MVSFQAAPVSSPHATRAVNIAVLTCALGYFVDIYDLLLFGIVRIPSLRAIGVPEEQMLNTGVFLINMQMFGMLLGGIIWGVLGDRRGRKSVLFGSILLYSLANIANAFVTDVHMYGALRLIAGIGLAGELGAAITLVSEIMSKETRGYGTTIVASVGILGAVAASLIGDFFDWKVAYIVGGVMGLGLLTLRAGLIESGMFDQVKTTDVARGAFLKLFSQTKLLKRYVCCIAIGIPVWFAIGVLITFAPELGKEMGIEGATGSHAIMWSYAGLSLGDLVSGLLSQKLKSRKKSVLLFLILTSALVGYYVSAPKLNLSQLYALIAAIGFSVGYWAVFVTIAAEQFGTNMRATVATTVPNFVRGCVVPITLSFNALKPNLGALHSALVVGSVCLVIAFVALFFLKETHGHDLDYLEQI